MRTEAAAFPDPRPPVPGPTPGIPVLREYFAGKWSALGGIQRLRLIERLETESPCPLVDPDPEGDPGYRAYTFLHWGPGTSAAILSVNALVDHHDPGASEFEQLPASGLWAVTYRLPADVECGYRITTHEGPGPAPWRMATERRAIRLAADAGGPDPLNPLVGSSMNGGAHSVLRGPAAPASAWLAAATPRPGAGSGIMGGEPDRAPDLGPAVSWQVWDSLAARHRTVWIYEPPAGTATGPTPLLLLHDGQVWARYLDLAGTLDAAITAGVLPPLHVAMIDSLDVETRSEEIGGPVGTVDFIAADLLPQLRALLPVSADAADTIVSGASYGGLASLWQLARFPELVGAAVAQSPSLWRYDLDGPLLGLGTEVRIVLQAGIHEQDIHETTEALHRALEPTGMVLEFASISGGHDWAWWNPWLIRGLIRLLG